MCAEKFPLVSMGGRAEGLACADSGARTPIGASGNCDTTKILKDSCRVTFNINLDYSNENKQEKVEINWTKLQLATYFCCSLKEIMILNN